MTHRFNYELLQYSKDEELLTKVHDLWEANRPTGGAFLHELEPKVLEPFIRVCEELMASMVSKSELYEYNKLNLDTTRRLGHALDLLREIGSGKRPVSRSAIRSWVISLSVPRDEPKQEPREHSSVEDDYLRGAEYFFDDFREAMNGAEFDQLPPHAAVTRLAKGLAGLGASLNGVLQYLIEGDKDARKTLKEFKQDMEKIEPLPKVTRESHPNIPGPGARYDNQSVWRDEVQPKLENLANSHDKVGGMTRSEILVLSAGLDVAIRARNNERK